MSGKFNDFDVKFFLINNLTKKFGGLTAIDQLSFQVREKEIFSIIGPNGAGKSTIFNCINGLYKPDQGSIFFKDKEITSSGPHQVAKLGIARTFQNLELFSYMTTMDNLLLGRHLLMKASIFGILGLNFKFFKAAKEENAHRRKVEEIIDFLEIQAYRNHPVVALPYGIQKLIELGRALALEPDLLLLDEPAAGLNNEERKEMVFWIKDIRDELGITTIVIEHNMQLVQDISDRILAINFGKKIAEGTVVEVLQDEEVVRAYLGEEIKL